MSAFSFDNGQLFYNGRSITAGALLRGITAHNDIGRHVVDRGVLTVPKHVYVLPSLQFTRNRVRGEFIGICAFFNRPDVLAGIAALFRVASAVCTFHIDNLETCAVIMGGPNEPYINRELGHFDVYVAIVADVAVVSAAISEVY
jgi:hypothetical protein